MKQVNWTKATFGMIDVWGVGNRNIIDKHLKTGGTIKVTMEIVLEAAGLGNWDGTSREYYGEAKVLKARMVKS